MFLGALFEFSDLFSGEKEGEFVMNSSEVSFLGILGGGSTCKTLL
jgi:hypothetical protein